MASLLLTYVLWMFGGIFGFHHLYLGRPYHAFVWYSTLGGVFGLGWLRDLWRIPDYVTSSNAERKYKSYQVQHISHRPRPSCGMPRFIGMFVMGFLVGSGLCGLLPNYDLDTPSYPFYRFCSISVILIGSSLGVYLVGNVGVLQCSWKYPVIGALVSIPWLITDPANITMATTLSTFATWWFGLHWKPVEPLCTNRGSKFGVYLVLVVMWTSVLGYGIYFNATISINGEERIPVRVVLNNFFASPAWRETKESFYQLYESLMEDGWGSAYEDASDLFDFSGEVTAYKTLGLSRDATQEEITKTCRKLSGRSHPDRFKTESEKEAAQAKFIEIQRACDILNNYGPRRAKKRRGDDEL